MTRSDIARLIRTVDMRLRVAREAGIDKRPAARAMVRRWERHRAKAAILEEEAETLKTLAGMVGLRLQSYKPYYVVDASKLPDDETGTRARFDALAEEIKILLHGTDGPHRDRIVVLLEELTALAPVPGRARARARTSA